MPPRTRAKRAIEEETYTSTPPIVQKRFPSRRKSIRTYTSKARKPDKRQSTLTQVDFGRLHTRDEIGDSDDDEVEDDDHEERPTKRRKYSRFKSDGEVSRKKRQSTLTQIDFVKRRKVQDSEDEGLLSEDEEGGVDLEPHPETNEMDAPVEPIEVPEGISNDSAAIAQHEESNRNQVTDPIREAPRTHEQTSRPLRNPQTPKRVRTLAVPSSQTPPTTPLSAQKTPRHPESGKDRSPLQERSTNNLIPRQLMRSLSATVQSPTKPSADEPAISSPVVMESPIKPKTIRSTPNIPSAIESSSYPEPRAAALTISSSNESPTKQRAREFRARMDELRNGGALQQSRRKRRQFRLGQVIRSSTEVSLEMDEEVAPNRTKTGETQFAIGEETQAILGQLDLACVGAEEQHTEDEEDEGMEEESEETNKNAVHLNNTESAMDNDESHQLDSVEILDLTNAPDHDTLQSRHLSPEISRDSYDEEERVPSSQNETPRNTIRHSSTSHKRYITFSDTPSLPQDPPAPAPISTPPVVNNGKGTQDSVSAQLLRETQAYAEYVASSSPVAEALPSPIRSTRSQYSMNPGSEIGRTVRLSQASTASEISRQPSSNQTLHFPPGSHHSARQTAYQTEIQIPSSPLLRPQNPISSSPVPQNPLSSANQNTPGSGILRFLRGPITVSQLIPESLRSGGFDSIGLPPRWQDSEDDDDDDDDDDDEL